MINERHPVVGAQIAQSWEDGPTTPTLRSVSEGARHLVGLQVSLAVRPWWKGAHLTTPRTTSQACSASVGSMRPHLGWSANSVRLIFSTGLQTTHERWCDRKAGQATRVLSLTCFEFCSSAAFVCTFLCPSAAAGVAVKSVYLDTTVHLAFRQVFLGERSLPWRAWQLEVVAKEEPESPATNVTVRDFDLGVPNIAMKLLQTAFLSLGELGWHWKPPWSHLASVTVREAEVSLTVTELL